MDDLLLSEVQIIEKNREQTKKYNGVILGSILPKNERNYQNIGKKKRKKNTEASVLRKIESSHAKVVTQEFLLAIFAQQRTKHYKLLFKPRFIFSVSERK